MLGTNNSKNCYEIQTGVSLFFMIMLMGLSLCVYQDGRIDDYLSVINGQCRS